MAICDNVGTAYVRFAYFLAFGAVRFLDMVGY